MYFQLLLQKEREDITASYKSTQAAHLKENDVSSVPSVSASQELGSRGNLPADGTTASQSFSGFTHPVATEHEFFQGRKSPNYTAGLQRIQAPASNVGIVGLTGSAVTHAFSRQMSDNTPCAVGDYHSFRIADKAPGARHLSLDSSFARSHKLKDLMPQYLSEHSLLNVNSPCARSVPPSSGVGNSAHTLSESISDSVNEQSHSEFEAVHTYGGISDEAVLNYGNISGINVTYFVLFLITRHAIDTVGWVIRRASSL